MNDGERHKTSVRRSGSIVMDRYIDVLIRTKWDIWLSLILLAITATVVL